MNVLLVEDETTLADVLARNLRAHGHDVRCAFTARDALSSIEAQRPDALVLDVNLPDETGWQVLRSIDSGDLERMHVVVISAAPISPGGSKSSSPPVASSSPSRSTRWPAPSRTPTSWRCPVSDLLYLLLTLGMFAGLAIAVWALERVER